VFSTFIGSRLLTRLTSLELAVVFLGLLCLVILPGTFMESRQFYGHPLFMVLLALFGLQLTVCTIRRWQRLAKSTLIIHCGVIVTLVGGMFGSLGFVATVNVYEGASTNTAYRWDLENDVPLGLSIKVNKVYQEFYPLPVKIGVLKGGEKHALITLKTGETFELGDVTVRLGQFDDYLKKVDLSLLRNGMVVGTADTDGKKSQLTDFPYDFKLVAYQTPKIKRSWVDIELVKEGQFLASGRSEINHPFIWEGLYFFNTLSGHDKEGLSFAGIQVVRDPGRPFVFIGMVLTCLGAIGAFIRRFYGTR
jgi:cytochrome c biogenesis protein ResB